MITRIKNNKKYKKIFAKEYKNLGNDKSNDYHN